MFAQAGMGPQFICLTTPETSPFPVTIYDGAGKLVTSAMISRGQPFQFELSDTYSQILISPLKVGKPMSDAGLVIHGSKSFYAYFRTHGPAGADACQLNCKGRAALGKTFRIGHMRQVTDKTGGRSNFIGVMATRDSTLIILSGFDPATSFTGGANISSDGSIRVWLQKGESVVFAHIVGGIDDEQPRNGIMGALLTASEPVAVNCGSWLGAPVIYQSNDIGADQIVPLERVGTTYILCRGGGPTSLEHPIVIAHKDKTLVWINDEVVPAATLNAGEYYIVPTKSFSAHGNMYIRSSEPVFVYQMTGGEKEGKYSLHSGAFFFVPPINCGLPNTVDYVFQPHKIGIHKFDAGLTVVALRDSTVTVRMNGKPVPLGAPSPVPGNPDFVTYSNLDLFNHTKATANEELSIEAGGAIQVALLERYQYAGFSAFFSGYQERAPEIQLNLHGDGICPDTLTANGYYDGVQWIYGDSVLRSGPDSIFIVAAPGTYKAVGYIGACFSTATAVDSIEVPLTEPKFPYSITEPSCFGARDGQIAFGTPNGGAPPYRYSINNGASFAAETIFDHIGAGKYKLIVQDSSGCYNEPIRLELGQPDCFYVVINTRRLPDPFKSGDLAELEAYTSHPVSALLWTPPGNNACTDCTKFDFRPESTTWVWVTAQDSSGCEASDSFLIVVDPRIYAPNVIAPESARGNDRFVLFSENPLPVQRVSVFDRWGGQVFQRFNIYTNNANDGWDGRINGKLAAPGVYTFVAWIELEPGRTAMITGSITLI
ncbi:MAG: gliding motility-associated C-terminal domain-containing protein [Thermoanaerobaculia bacterium]|nr:gliding motility-associated C-terminal domain-containing protein [Thermoanaerobaculia bacterium]